MLKRKLAIAEIRKTRINNIGKKQIQLLINKTLSTKTDYTFLSICEVIKQNLYCKYFLNSYQKFELAKYINDKFGNIISFSKFKNYRKAVFYYFK